MGTLVRGGVGAVPLGPGVELPLKDGFQVLPPLKQLTGAVHPRWPPGVYLGREGVRGSIRDGGWVGGVMGGVGWGRGDRIRLRGVLGEAWEWVVLCPAPGRTAQAQDRKSVV